MYVCEQNRLMLGSRMCCTRQILCLLERQLSDNKLDIPVHLQPILHTVSASARQNIDFAARILAPLHSGVVMKGMLGAHVSYPSGHRLTCRVEELDGLGDNAACNSVVVNQE